MHTEGREEHICWGQLTCGPSRLTNNAKENDESVAAMHRQLVKGG